MKKILGIMVLGLLLSGCLTTTPVINPSQTPDKNYFKTNYFDGKKLSNVEGIWRWMNGNYQVAIIKNDLGVETNYEYLGIVMENSFTGNITKGSIKLKLNKSANSNVYVGQYVVTDGMAVWDSGGTFLVQNNLITTSIRNVGSVSMIKLYPDNAQASNSTSTTKDKNKGPSSGSAFFVDNRGHIITNYHVVESCNNKSKINYNDKVLNANLIAKDKYLDLALLKVDTNNNSYISLSNDAPYKLQKIIAAGYPFGKSLSDDLKFTSGIVSSLKGVEDDSTRLQIDAALNHGNSGGPIVDAESGELIAVAVSGLRKDFAESINFGIKAAQVKGFLESNQINTKLKITKLSNSGLSSHLEKSTIYTYCN